MGVSLEVGSRLCCGGGVRGEAVDLVQVECMRADCRFTLDDANDPGSGVGCQGCWGGAEANDVKVCSLRVGRGERVFLACGLVGVFVIG